MSKRVEINKLDSFGRGIGNIDGKIVFVGNALPGEVCDIKILEDKKNYCVGEVLNRVQKSSKRVAAKCPYYEVCGGCDIEHMTYLDSVLWKEEYLTELFLRNKLYEKEIKVEKCNTPWNYRNKITLKVEEGKVGFYSSKSHQLVEIQECLIASDCLNKVLQDFSMYSFLNGNLMIRCNENNEILMDIETKEEVKIEKEFLTRHKIVGILINHKAVYGNSYFFERKNGVLYQVSFDSFFQVNPDISSKLFSNVLSCVENHSKVLDLYCGVGTLGLQIAKKVSHVTGIEVIQNAILNAISNAKLNHFSNCSFHLGKVEDIISKIEHSFSFVIVDPPRSGLDKKTREVLFKMKPEKILYISCNPNTLVRDLKEMSREYVISNVRGFDMFPYTRHVECVCVLKLSQTFVNKGKIN